MSRLAKTADQTPETKRVLIDFVLIILYQIDIAFKKHLLLPVFPVHVDSKYRGLEGQVVENKRYYGYNSNKNFVRKQ